MTAKPQHCRPNGTYSQDPRQIYGSLVGTEYNVTFTFSVNTHQKCTSLTLSLQSYFERHRNPHSTIQLDEIIIITTRQCL